MCMEANVVGILLYFDLSLDTLDLYVIYYVIYINMILMKFQSTSYIWIVFIVKLKNIWLFIR